MSVPVIRMTEEQRVHAPRFEETAALVAGGSRGAVARLADRFLGLRLFYKILVANGLVVALAAIGGMLLMAKGSGPRAIEVMTVLGVAGVVASVLANAVILRLALRPLERLERTARLVQEGDLSARTARSPLADPDLDRLIAQFNGMLEGLEGYRARLREIAARALRAEEEERKRIARELHDETAQSLAALLVHLRIARGLEDTAARQALLDQVRQELAETLEGMRRYARGLRPPSLDELGLGPAIDAYARSMGEATGLHVDLDVDGLGGRLVPDVELAVYRIVQEAVFNAVRHAEAERVRISVSVAAGRVVASVVDDGQGFDPEEVLAEEESGLGIFGMQERAAYFGGSVSLESRIGAGTAVRAEIPLHRHAGAGRHEGLGAPPAPPSTPA